MIFASVVRVFIIYVTLGHQSHAILGIPASDCSSLTDAECSGGSSYECDDLGLTTVPTGFNADARCMYVYAYIFSVNFVWACNDRSIVLAEILFCNCIVANCIHCSIGWKYIPFERALGVVDGC